MLWSPETPTLYNLIVRVRDEQGNVIDGYLPPNRDPQHRIQGRSRILAERKAL